MLATGVTLVVFINPWTQTVVPLSKKKRNCLGAREEEGPSITQSVIKSVYCASS